MASGFRSGCRCGAARKCRSAVSSCNRAARWRTALLPECSRRAATCLTHAVAVATLAAPSTPETATTVTTPSHPSRLCPEATCCSGNPNSRSGPPSKGCNMRSSRSPGAAARQTLAAPNYASHGASITPQELHIDPAPTWCGGTPNSRSTRRCSPSVTSIQSVSSRSSAAGSKQRLE